MCLQWTEHACTSASKTLWQNQKCSHSSLCYPTWDIWHSVSPRWQFYLRKHLRSRLRYRQLRYKLLFHHTWTVEKVKQVLSRHHEVSQYVYPSKPTSSGQLNETWSKRVLLPGEHRNNPWKSQSNHSSVWNSRLKQKSQLGPKCSHIQDKPFSPAFFSTKSMTTSL